MQLKNSFTVPADPGTAWAILLDVPRIAPCMPGAELTETVGERAYRGNAKVRVGPVALVFAGEAEITALDEAARTATVAAKGNDTKGRGAAEATVVFALSEAGEGRTRVDIATDLALTGSVAQYGRAAGLIDAIAGQIISDFARNLERHLAESGSATAAPPPAGAGEAAAQGPTAGRPPLQGPDPALRPEPPPLSADNSISGIRLFFRALWSMLRKALGGAR